MTYDAHSNRLAIQDSRDLIQHSKALREASRDCVLRAERAVRESQKRVRAFQASRRDYFPGERSF